MGFRRMRFAVKVRRLGDIRIVDIVYVIKSAGRM